MRTSPPRSRSTAGVATSSSPLPQAAGRGPSPGACIEDCRRAPDRQFITGKHPFGEGADLCARTPFLYREKERGSFRAEAQGRRGISNCWAWNSSDAENQEPRTKNQYELWQTSERGLVFRTSPIPEATASGPEGRQKVAQRVSAGFRPPMKTQPREGRQNSSAQPPLPPYSSCPEITRGQHPRTEGRWICNVASLPIQPGWPLPSTNATPKGISGIVSATRVISDWQPRPAGPASGGRSEACIEFLGPLPCFVVALAEI